MKAKALEIRDRNTFIPALAIEMTADNAAQHYLLRRAGYGETPLIALTHLRTKADMITYDCYDWRDARTMKIAHDWIARNWDTLKDGDIVDVEFILGETAAPKLSERVEFPDV